MEIVGVLIEKYEDEHVPELSKVGPHINARGFLKPLGLTANALAKAIGNHAAT